MSVFSLLKRKCQAKQAFSMPAVLGSVFSRLLHCFPSFQYVLQGPSKDSLEMTHENIKCFFNLLFHVWNLFPEIRMPGDWLGLCLVSFHSNIGRGLKSCVLSSQLSFLQCVVFPATSSDATHTTRLFSKLRLLHLTRFTCTLGFRQGWGQSFDFTKHHLLT